MQEKHSELFSIFVEEVVVLFAQRKIIKAASEGLCLDVCCTYIENLNSEALKLSKCVQ